MNLYVVRNQKGQYFRSKGRSGYGKSWVTELDKAKFYGTIGQARSRVTFFYKSNPELGCPQILQFSLDEKEAIVIDGEEDTRTRIKKKEEKLLQSQIKWREEKRQDLLRQEEEIRTKLKALQ